MPINKQKDKIQIEVKKHQISGSIPWWKFLILFLLLILLGTGIYYSYKGYIIEVLSVLAAIIFGIGVVLVFAYVVSKELFLWIIGMRSEYNKVLKASQIFSIGLTRAAIKYFPIGLDNEEKERLRDDVPIFVQMRFMANINNIIMRFFIGAFAAAFALLGTIALMNQNKKIETQTNLLEVQTKRLDQQTYLQEAERRSSLVFLFSNIMDAINSELKEDIGEKGKRDLSPQLMGRINALSTRLKPYRYLDGDNLTKKPLSPERGQLLVSLLGSELDIITYKKIYQRLNLNSADLKGAVLSDANLRSADLLLADLRSADLRSADLSGADLRGANLSEANLSGADLSEAILLVANLSEANLSGADLSGTDLRNADLIGVDLRSANLSDADLSGADLSGANLIGANLRIVDLSEARLNEVECDSLNISWLFSNTLISKKYWYEVEEYPSMDNLDTNSEYVYRLKERMQK